MPQLLRKRVNIYNKPKLAQLTLRKHNLLALGDLHGNAIKFLHFLDSFGILSILSETGYQHLCNIIRTPPARLDAAMLQTFCNIINESKASNNKRLVLIGDELADRAFNDYFMLKLIERLSRSKVEFDVLLSNHSADFIDVLERGLKGNFFGGISHRNSGNFGKSLDRLYALIERGIVSREEIITLARKHYLPRVKLISYSLDKHNNQITLYTHAPAGLEVIEPLARKLGVDHIDISTLEGLTSAIDRINAAFSKRLMRGDAYSSLIEPSDTMGAINLEQDPIEYLIWNRNYERTRRPSFMMKPQSSQTAYKIAYVHGHDPATNKRLGPHQITLDSQLGNPQAHGSHIGESRVSFSHDEVPYPSARPMHYAEGAHGVDASTSPNTPPNLDNEALTELTHLVADVKKTLQPTPPRLDGSQGIHDALVAPTPLNPAERSYLLDLMNDVDEALGCSMLPKASIQEQIVAQPTATASTNSTNLWTPWSGFNFFSLLNPASGDRVDLSADPVRPWSSTLGKKN